MRIKFWAFCFIASFFRTFFGSFPINFGCFLGWVPGRNRIPRPPFKSPTWRKIVKTIFFIFLQRILQLDPAAVRSAHLPGWRLQRSHPPGEDLHPKHVHYQGKYIFRWACASLGSVMCVTDAYQTCPWPSRHVCVNCQACAMCINCESSCQACAWQACASPVKHVNHSVRHVRQLSAMLITLSGMCLAGMCVKCQACESHCQACAWQACASNARHVNKPARHVRQLSGMLTTLSGIYLAGMCVNCQACESHCQACAWRACVSTARHVNHTVRHVPGRHVRQLPGMWITLPGMCLAGMCIDCKACESHCQACASTVSMWKSHCQACQSNCQACAWQACASTVRHVNHFVRHARTVTFQACASPVRMSVGNFLCTYIHHTLSNSLGTL